MHDSDEHHVFFAVTGFDGPVRQISLMAGIEPDDYWVAGEPFSAAMPEARRRDNRWILASGLDRWTSHEDHFRRLLYKLKALAPQLELLQQHYRCGVGVSRFFFMNDPAFYLSEELLDEYRALNLDIGFDQLAIGGGAELPPLSEDLRHLDDDNPQIEPGDP